MVGPLTRAPTPSTVSGPPPRYVSFVTRHLGALRLAATAVVGDERDADHLYPDVLMDVAIWWGWLEILRRLSRRDDLAERWMWRSFERRAARWHATRAARPATTVPPCSGGDPGPVTRSRGRHWSDALFRTVDEDTYPVDPAVRDIRVWGPEGPPPPPVAVPASRVADGTGAARSAAVRTSAALRMAARLQPVGRPEAASALAEAAVAWWHAYEWWRRVRRAGWIAVGLVALALLVRLRQAGIA